MKSLLEKHHIRFELAEELMNSQIDKLESMQFKEERFLKMKKNKQSFRKKSDPFKYTNICIM